MVVCVNVSEAKDGNTIENHENEVDLHIVSIETIKPASPTPHHLRTFNLSIFDQIIFNCYTPLVLFLPNPDQSKSLKNLKESLSEVLTQYYPFAGEIKDDFHIECNDKGVYFVEARVNQTLKDFLCQPDDKKVSQLLPQHPSDTEPSSRNYVVSIQVNKFDCGGIALSSKLSHKIIDIDTYLAFMNAWAATVRDSPEKITPSFMASKIFPNNPSLKHSLSPKLTASKQTTTKRFVFDSTAVSSLKNQLVIATGSTALRGPTRVEATGALIWKAAARAASMVRPFTPKSPHALLTAVNLRRKASPVLSKETIGSIVVTGVGVCFPDSQPDLPTLMGRIRESIAKLNPELIEAMKGENGYQTADQVLKMMNDLFEVLDEGDFVTVTSLLNGGIYDVDFGWGKPIWFYYASLGFSKLVVLNETLKHGGVEAIVTLSPEEMEIFERDPEILSYACVNPSPLQFLN